MIVTGLVLDENDVIVTGLVFMRIAGLGPDLSTKIDVIVTGFVFDKICKSRTGLKAAQFHEHKQNCFGLSFRFF